MMRIRLFQKAPQRSIILLQDIAGLGFQGQEVQVKRGHARNHLIPKQFAVLATKENKLKYIKQFTEKEKETMTQILADYNRMLSLNKVKLNYLVEIDTKGQVAAPISINTIKEDLLKRGKLIKGDVVDESISTVNQIGDTYITIHTAKNTDAKIRIRLIRKKTDLKKYLQKIKEKEKAALAEKAAAPTKMEDDIAEFEHSQNINIEYEDEEEADIKEIKVMKEKFTYKKEEKKDTKAEKDKKMKHHLKVKRKNQVAQKKIKIN